MQGNAESDYLLFVENKAIAIIEAKKSNPLGNGVEKQAKIIDKLKKAYECMKKSL